VKNLRAKFYVTLRSRERRSGSDPPQFQHAMADIAILGEMGRCDGFAAAGNHLIDRAALGEMRVELAAKFARPAGASVEATDDCLINVFHEERLLRKKAGFAFTM
jgi:hypothetical protein